MTSVFVILGALALAGALAGCVVPVLPGPALAFASLVLASLAFHWQPYSGWFLAGMAFAAVLVSLADNVLPLLGARRYGASKLSVWGSIIGMLVGLFIFPPWTIFLGAFAGAVAGEWIDKGEMNRALAAGWGVFVGTVAAMALKLAYVAVALVYFVKALF